MPITVSSFLVPASSVPFLSEDIHSRGGFMTVADAAARDALHVAKRKKGMIVVLQSDGTWWTIGASISTWERVNLLQQLTISSSLTVDSEGNLSIAGLNTASTGQVLTRDSTGKAVWATAPGAGVANLPDPNTGSNGDILQIIGGAWVPASLASNLSNNNSLAIDGSGKLTVAGTDAAANGHILTKSGSTVAWAAPAGSGFTPIRVTPAAYVSPSLAQNASADFSITGAGNSAIVLNLTVNRADALVECFETSARTSGNPYKFLSYTGHLTDDGTSVLEDLSIQYNRKYAIIVNRDNTDTTYWFRVTNKNAASVSITVTMDLLVIQP